ncbi:MAG: DEAD/DEAH box helicase [Candidatus Peribacteraceae bacterium]|nr:DEAD/DEAH box helicase [Candidatus Peribacteraceae bacterium]
MGPRSKRPIDETLLKQNYVEQVAACETREDFLALFALHGLDEDIWRSSESLRRKGFDGLYDAIRGKFEERKGWAGFLEFMNPQKADGSKIDASILRLPHTKQVAACETREDFLALFALHGLDEDTWRNSDALRKGYQGICTAIRQKFREQGGWPGFLAFMGPRSKRPIDETLLKQKYVEQVAACETREDFLALFRLHGFQGDTWRNSGSLLEASLKGLLNAITDRYQGSWRNFLAFMDLEKEEQKIDESIKKLPYPQQVSICKTRADFLLLFSLYGLTERVWRNSAMLRNATSSGFYTAIKNRFDGGWPGFLEFMGPQEKTPINTSILELPMSRQVAACETREDFLALFILHGLDKDTWRNSQAIKQTRAGGLYQPILDRFRDQGGWEGFLAFMDGRDEASLEARIESLGLQDAIALLADSPGKLRMFLAVNHPELLAEEADRLVAHAFRQLHNRRIFEYGDFEQLLEPCQLTRALPAHTGEGTVLLEGVAPGADSLIVEGAVTSRRIRVGEDGHFHARVALAIGQRNNLRLIPLHHGNRQSGPALQAVVHQTGTPDDIEALVGLLNQMGRETLDEIRTDAGRQEFVVRQTELALIRKFAGSFECGRDYVQELIAKSTSPTVRTVLRKVLARFREINKATYPNVREDSPLYFFQKYCVAEIQRRIAAGERGVVLANDPGLGKTRTALVAVNGDPATIIAPNAVVTSWSEEAARALLHSDILSLQNRRYDERLQLLRDTDATHIVTNIDYLRASEGDERYGLLADQDTIVVHDEAHGLLNLGSEQSKGARRLQAKFHLFLSATPFKDPKTLRRMLHNLEPDDPRFASDAAFMRAFPANDPEALRTLSIFKNRYVIRFTKEDVLEEMDPALPIEQQHHRLPRKEQVPETEMGSFTLLEQQCQAIYELMLDWQAWCRRYDRYVPRDAVARLDALRGNQFALAKVHALRQVANNPAYIGLQDAEDPKACKLLADVETLLAEGRKVVIFCQYNAQAEKYAAMFAAHCPSLYTGVTASQKLRTNTEGEPIRYRQEDNGRWAMDERGLPLEDPNGEVMSAMDYERLAFQNAPERRVMIATYSAGAVGVTFTAGKAMIFDDLPADCVQEIQAEDRIHRIDHEYQTHQTVRYARMVARYPEAFLERMRQVWVRRNDNGTFTEVRSRRVAEREELPTAYETFFAQGTFDEVRVAGLRTQRRRFRLINDGIVDSSEMPELPEPAALAF